MKWDRWEDLHENLLQCTWFANVSQAFSAPDSRTRAVESWEKATQWATAEISWWCVNEASNILRLQLHNNHRSEYRKWNEWIKVFTPSLDTLLNEVVIPQLPVDVDHSKIIAWIRSHLTSAYLEIAYSEFGNVQLTCDQVEWYAKGHFPCGWFVPNEESFPSEAITLVF